MHVSGYSSADDLETIPSHLELTLEDDGHIFRAQSHNEKFRLEVVGCPLNESAG